MRNLGKIGLISRYKMKFLEYLNIKKLILFIFFFIIYKYKQTTGGFNPIVTGFDLDI